MRGSCPDHEELVAYVSHRLDEARRSAFEDHLDACSTCLLLVSELARDDEPEAPPPPADDARVPWARSAPASSAPAPHALPRFGKYRLDAVLGQGAMGTVYAAHDDTLERMVALKIMRPHADAAGARRRLAREARALARLSHPHVVTVYDAGETDGRLYIAMELVAGPTLASWVRARPTASPAPAWQEALLVLLRAGEGLAAAHAAGLVHRDFKPENVLLGPGGTGRWRVVVTDFGLAAAPRNEPVATDTAGGPVSDLALTSTGAVVGTPRYMSPEQFEGGLVDARSDQFSFAVTAYELLYQQPPFAGDTLEKLRRTVAEGVVTPVPDGTRVTPALREVLLRALAPDPAARYPSLAELLRELQPFAPGNSPDALGASVAASGASRRPKLLRAGAGVLVAASSLLAVAGSGRLRTANANAPKTPAESADAAATVVTPQELGPRKRRVAVLVDAFANRTREPRLDGVVETSLVADLACSTKLDPYAGTFLRDLAAELGGPNEPGSPSELAARVVASGGEPIVVTGEVSAVAPDMPQVRIRLTATDASRARAVLHREEVVPDAASVTPALVRLAAALRSAIGDDDVSDAAGNATLSSSLDALSAWAEARAQVGLHRWSLVVGPARRALAADPAFVLARFDLGQALSASSRTPEAVSELDAVLARPESLCTRRRLLAFGFSAGMLGHFAAAANAYQRYLTLWPDDLSVQILAVSTLRDERELGMALELARSAATAHPHALHARASVLSTLFLTGAFAEAAQEGEALLAEFPLPPERALGRLVAADVLLDRDDEARGLLRRQATVDDELSDEEEADLAMYRGRLTDAEALLRRQIRALVKGPDATSARTELILLAQLLARRGDREGALAAIESALPGAHDEGSAVTQYQLVRLLADTGGERSARALSQGWADSKILLWRVNGKLAEGDLLRAGGHRREARAAYEDALRLDDVWLAHERLAELHLEASAWDDAAREFSVCLARKAEGVDFMPAGLHELSAVYLGLARAKDGGRKPDAADAYRTLLALEPAAQDDPFVEQARSRLAALQPADRTGR